jgi:hypothetical protein
MHDFPSDKHRSTLLPGKVSFWKPSRFFLLSAAAWEMNGRTVIFSREQAEKLGSRSYLIVISVLSGFIFLEQWSRYAAKKPVHAGSPGTFPSSIVDASAHVYLQ